MYSTILIIDDDKKLNELLTDFLGDFGFNTLTATRPQDGLKKLKHKSPDLVILDEPFTGLDPLNIELLREIILLEKERGTTIIFSTHMLAEAEKICDAICLIEGGEKILDGTLDSVRQEFPMHSVHVAFADGSEPPADLPQVTQRKFEDGVWRLTMVEGSDPQELLRLLAAKGALSYFSANRPSLSEIFLTAVRRSRGEPADGRSEDSPAISALEGEV